MHGVFAGGRDQEAGEREQGAARDEQREQRRSPVGRPDPPGEGLGVSPP